MRSWKISGLRDLIFDGPIVWLVVGSCRMTKLIKFDPSTCDHIDVTKPDWKNSTTAYRARVTALGPVAGRDGFLVQDHSVGDDDAHFTHWRNEAGQLSAHVRDDLCLRVFDRTAVRLRAECDAISTCGDRYILVDGERDGRHHLPRIWQVKVHKLVQTEKSLDPWFRTLVCPATWPWCYATTHGVTTGLYFVDFEANRHHASSPDRFILDVQGDRRLERNNPVRGAGSKLFLNDQCFKFTRSVYGARFSPDGMTAFTWGARELVQFDIN